MSGDSLVELLESMIAKERSNKVMGSVPGLGHGFNLRWKSMTSDQF